MRLALATALTLALGAGPALALSCLEPDPVRSYDEAVAQTDPPFTILVGDLEPIGKPDANGDVEMLFTGEEMTSGWTKITTNVYGTKECVGEWCGEPAAVKNALIFAKVFIDTKRIEVAFEACPAWVFADIDPVQLSMVESEYSAFAEANREKAPSQGNAGLPNPDTDDIYEMDDMLLGD